MKISSPSPNASSSASLGEAPSEWKKSEMWGAVLDQSDASAAPSKLVEPMITARSATVPGSGSSFGRPVSQRRIPTSRPLRAKTDSREKRLKYTENASPRELHVSTP